MTKVELQEKCFELLHKSHLRMMAAVPRAIEAGALDYEADPAESYWLAKNIILFILADEAQKWESGQVSEIHPCFISAEEINNLRRMR